MKMCEHIKKNIAGRNPETTRKEIHSNAIPLLIRENMPPLIFDYFKSKLKKTKK